MGHLDTVAKLEIPDDQVTVVAAVHPGFPDSLDGAQFSLDGFIQANLDLADKMDQVEQADILDPQD